MMPVRLTRRFTLADAMITVAAIAPALAAMRSLWSFDLVDLRNSPDPIRYANILLIANYNAFVISLMAASSSCTPCSMESTPALMQ